MKPPAASPLDTTHMLPEFGQILLILALLTALLQGLLPLIGAQRRRTA